DRQLRARFLLGTGLCGGFTTYSALALQAAELVQDSAMLTAAGYALVTLVAGTSASVAGLALGGAVGARRSAALGRSVAPRCASALPRWAAVWARPPVMRWTSG